MWTKKIGNNLVRIFGEKRCVEQSHAKKEYKCKVKVLAPLAGTWAAMLE